MITGILIGGKTQRDAYLYNSEENNFNRNLLSNNWRNFYFHGNHLFLEQDLEQKG